MAHAVCDTADMFKAPLLGMVGTLHETIYEKRGHVFLSEYYTDLDYGDDGQLAITREHEEVNSSGGGGTQPEGHPREPDPLARRQGRESARRHHLRPFRYPQCRRHRDGGAGGGGSVLVRGLSDRRLVVRPTRSISRRVGKSDHQIVELS